VLSSVISVTAPASDLTLLSIAELRTAVGLSDNSRDADLTRIGGYIADAIAQACKVATDGATPPTLRQESLTETFRLNRWWNRTSHYTPKEMLILARRPIVSVASVVEAGNTLDPTAPDYEIRSGTGMLLRLFNNAPSHWAHDLIVVTYTAGWATVPQGLKRAAEKMMRLYWAQSTRDPLLRQENIPGVLEQTYWIGSPSDPSIPQDVMDDLGPYINPQA